MLSPLANIRSFILNNPVILVIRVGPTKVKKYDQSYTVGK